jgi:transmembrane sensor
MLPDRSRAELSTATALSVDFSSTRRLVRLLDGEAWFQVAHDPGRPFILEAAGGKTTAIGTAFAVARQGDGARVSVTEHAVRIVAGSIVRTVSEGQSLRYGTDGEGQVENADPATLAWRSGRLVFVNRPLGEVAAQLDRWTGGHTIVADEALAAHPVTLMTGTQEAGDALVKLAAAVPMRITRLTSLLTIVRTY